MAQDHGLILSLYLALCFQPPAKTDGLLNISLVWKEIKTKAGLKAEQATGLGIASLT